MKRFYFRNLSKTKNAMSSTFNDINRCVVKKTTDGWSEPRMLESPVNSDKIDTCPTVTEEGTLYFFNARGGGFGNGDIYRSKLINGKHIEVENLGEPINTENDEIDPFIAPDESYLIFCSNKPCGVTVVTISPSPSESRMVPGQSW